MASRFEGFGWPKPCAALGAGTDAALVESVAQLGGGGQQQGIEQVRGLGTCFHRAAAGGPKNTQRFGDGGGVLGAPRSVPANTLRAATSASIRSDLPFSRRTVRLGRDTSRTWWPWLISRRV